MHEPQSALDFARQHRGAALEDLKEFLRIPSISTLPEHKPDLVRASNWVADQLRQLGLEPVEVLPTAGHPVVYGEWLKSGDSAPTVLVYGHYDVQPVDPLKLWESPPFEPAIRGEDIFARGASDMKGQIVAQLKAAEALVRTSGLPLNLKFMIEGEEEIGSPNLGAFIEQQRSKLACDFCLNLDAGVLGPDVPSLTLALRGLAYFEVRIQGPAGDLHSGTFGGAVENPANVLARLIAGMHDAAGRVALPGFYDQVRPMTERDRADLAQLPQAEAWWMEQSATKALGGEAGFTATERATSRPTLDVNGMLSGFTGAGSKTVLPAKAMAKISTRLVPDQRPEQVHKSLIEYMRRSAPPTVDWEVEILAGAIPGIIDRDAPEVQTAAKALEAAWGKPAVYKREGGTVPVVGMIQELLGVNSLLLGFGLPDDNLHAPNEKFHLPNFYRGIETLIRFLAALPA
jgi:acetylornithine deacetylase/succinyl-diaminopimelate desuccinylase-like protein